MNRMTRIANRVRRQPPKTCRSRVRKSEPDAEPKAQRADDPEPDHEAVGIGVIGGPLIDPEQSAQGDDPSTEDAQGTPKPGGLGHDGTIPNAPEGVAAGHTGEPSTFEPEEDEKA